VGPCFRKKQNQRKIKFKINTRKKMEEIYRIETGYKPKTIEEIQQSLEVIYSDSIFQEIGKILHKKMRNGSSRFGNKYPSKDGLSLKL